MARYTSGSMPPVNTEHSVLFSLSNLKEMARGYKAPRRVAQTAMGPDLGDSLSLNFFPQSTASETPGNTSHQLLLPPEPTLTKRSWVLPAVVLGIFALAFSMIAAAYWVVFYEPDRIKTILGQDPPVVASMIHGKPKVDQIPSLSPQELEKAAAAAAQAVKQADMQDEKADKKDEKPSGEKAVVPADGKKKQQVKKGSKARRSKRRYSRRRGKRRTWGLSKMQIRRGMRRILGRVGVCTRRYGGRKGKVNVQVTISGKSGKVRKARVKGRMARTRTGKCVRAAVASAKFSRFRGPPVRTTYPFLLR